MIVIIKQKSLGLTSSIWDQWNEIEMLQWLHRQYKHYDSRLYKINTCNNNKTALRDLIPFTVTALV